MYVCILIFLYIHTQCIYYLNMHIHIYIFWNVQIKSVSEIAYVYLRQKVTFARKFDVWMVYSKTTISGSGSGRIGGLNRGGRVNPGELPDWPL